MLVVRHTNISASYSLPDAEAVAVMRLSEKLSLITEWSLVWDL